MKKKKLIINIILFIFIIIFIYSLIQIIIHENDNNKINKQINDINKKITIKEIIDNENIELIEQKEEINKSDPYWDYIKVNLIDVDFNNLKKINSDVKGWIQVNGTNINYPFVQTNNNNYYLNHSFDKSKNGGGWVFLDYRNNLVNNNEKNTILYAHGRVNKTMFGSLKNILTSKWTKNKDNYIIKMSNEFENTLWQVFSIYRIPNTSDYIQTEFKNDDEYNTFVQMLLNRSQFNFNTTVNFNDRILTLSTCYNDNEKVVLHAKLIKKENKES